MNEPKKKDMVSWTKHCVKEWINQLQNIIDMGPSFDVTRGDLYPRMECPNCRVVDINNETMKCGRCGFIIPEDLQPPKFTVLLEILYKDKEKRIKEEAMKKEEEKRKTIFQARERLKNLNYYK